MGDAAAPTDVRLPVTVLTGALGAGKTTLLNHLLHQSDLKLAVIVNEFGDAGIDGALIDSGAEDLVELSSGCICCVVRADLIRTLRGLRQRVAGLDGVVIETTGLANPAPVIQTFLADQMLAAAFRIDTVVTVVDALHITTQLQHSEDAAAQVALADLLVLNKFSEAGDCAAITDILRQLNPLAPIERADRGQVRAEAIFGKALHESAPATNAPAPSSIHDHDHHHDHIARHGITSVTVNSDQPLQMAALESWMRALLDAQGADILRSKGIICCADDPRQLVLQSVHMMLEGQLTAPWPKNTPPQSRLVFIGSNLDAHTLQAGFSACAA